MHIFLIGGLRERQGVRARVIVAIYRFTKTRWRFTERFTIRKPAYCQPRGFSTQYRKSIYDLQDIPTVPIEDPPYMFL